MKIGILTFHRANNFGAALQCHALQTFLEQHGHNVYVIDFRYKAIEQVYYVLSPRLLFLRKNIIKAFIDYLFNLKNYTDMRVKRNEYEDFRKKYLHLVPFSKDINNDIDAFVAGSDQIWNLSLTNGFSETYFLEFPIKEKTLKISYAASSEVVSFREFKENKDEISHALNGFDSISVREPELKEELRKYTSKDIKVCVDPTFLLKKEYYERILKVPQERNYVLVYHMAETEEAVKLANAISQAKGLEVIEIHASFKSPCGIRHKKGLGPLQILGYIKYADTVITNSFHGTALSLILQKNLWVINTYKSIRLFNLLVSVGLQSRYISSLDEYNNNPINYDIVNENINKHIEKSEKFLEESLANRKS